MTVSVDKNSEIDSHCQNSMIESVMKANIMGYYNGNSSLINNRDVKKIEDEIKQRKRSTMFTKNRNNNLHMKDTTDI